MSTNQLTTTNSQSVQTAIRFYELFIAAWSVPNHPLSMMIAAALAMTGVGGGWMLLGGGMAASTSFLLGGVSLFVIGLALYKNYQSNKLAFDRLSVTISPEGIMQRVENTSSEARYEWSRVTSVRRVAGIILVCIEARQAIWICVPTRCFASAEDSRLFFKKCFDYWRQGQVKRHELGHKTRKKKTRPEIAAFIVMVFILLLTCILAITIRGGGASSLIGTAFLIEALILVPLMYKLDDGTQALTQANNALLANEPKKALAICDKALKRHGKNSRLHTIAGYSAYTIGEFDQGVNFCRAAVAADPEDALAYAGLAFGQREQGELQSAYDNISKAIELQPNIPWAYTIRANVLADWGRYQEALQQVDEAERWEGSNFSALHAGAAIRSCMYELDRAMEMIAQAERSCIENKRAAKEFSAVLATKGLIRSRRREFADARASIESAEKLDPDNPINAGIRASIAVRSGDMAFAAEALADARKHNLPVRSLFVWYSDMAIFQYKKGNVDEALQNTDLAIATARRAMPLAVKGAILVREGKPQEALPLLNEAISLDPYFMLAYESRARVYKALNDPERAEADRVRYEAAGFESFF